MQPRTYIFYLHCSIFCLYRWSIIHIHLIYNLIPFLMPDSRSFSRLESFPYIAWYSLSFLYCMVLSISISSHRAAQCSLWYLFFIHINLFLPYQSMFAFSLLLYHDRIMIYHIDQYVIPIWHTYHMFYHLRSLSWSSNFNCNQHNNNPVLPSALPNSYLSES